MIWTLEEDAILLRAEPLLARRAVAVIMGRDVDEVNRRLLKLRRQHEEERVVLPEIIKPRKCLSHKGFFVPMDKGMFICNPCKSKANWRDGQWMQPQ